MRKVFVLFIMLFLLTGCANQPPVKEVRLHDTQSQIPAANRAVEQDKAFRVAVSSILSPRETLTVYQPLLQYLETKLNLPVVLLQRKTYKEVNDLLKDGGADLAFVCSGGYVAGHETFGMELLAVPQVAGKTKYQSYIIADISFPGKSIADLAQRSFAFTDPLSFSGRIAPVYMLESTGVNSGRFFGRTFFTYSHDNAIQAVVDGIVDAAAVDSMILDDWVAKKPELTKRIKIIDKSLEVGNPPVVVPPNQDVVLKEKVKQLLLDMHKDTKGRKALEVLQYDQFQPPREEDYRSLQMMWHAVREKL